MTSITTCRTIADMRAQVAAWKAEGRRVGLVPTMGALHDGHLSLVKALNGKADRVIVSIFVNPTQFAAHEDLDTYPRQEADDLAHLQSLNQQAGPHVHAVYLPSVADIYPSGFATQITLQGPALGLESDERPHFFGGVAVVVAKLLMQSQCDMAIFGEKDYQQLLVIRQMARDLDLPCEIFWRADCPRTRRPRHVVTQCLSIERGARYRQHIECDFGANGTILGSTRTSRRKRPSRFAGGWI